MNLLKALVTVSGMTMISRVLGFVRDAVIARAFGAGLYTDAFFVAFKLPNLLRRVFAEGAFSQAFVPVLAEYKEKRGEADTRELLASVTGVLPCHGGSGDAGPFTAYGTLQALPRDTLDRLLAQLFEDGYLVQTDDQYAVLRMGDITPLKQPGAQVLVKLPPRQEPERVQPGQVRSHLPFHERFA